MYPNFADWPNLFQAALDRGVRGISKVAGYIARNTQTPVRSEADFDPEKLYRSVLRFVKTQVKRMGAQSWRVTMEGDLEEDYQNGSGAGYQSQAGNSNAGSSKTAKTAAPSAASATSTAPKTTTGALGRKPIQSSDLDKASELADKIKDQPGLDNPNTLSQKIKANVSSVGVGQDKADIMQNLVQAQLANKGVFGESAGGLKTWDVGYRVPRPAKGLQWYTVQAETFAEACKVARKHYGDEPYAGPLLKHAVKESANPEKIMAYVDANIDLYNSISDALGLRDEARGLLYPTLARRGYVERPKNSQQKKLNNNQWTDIAKMASAAFELTWDDDYYRLSIKGM